MEKGTIEETRIHWIDICETMPTQDDADAYGCVLAWSRMNGCIIVNWRNFKHYGCYLSHWARMPEEPKEMEQ